MHAASYEAEKPSAGAVARFVLAEGPMKWEYLDAGQFQIWLQHEGGGNKIVRYILRSRNGIAREYRHAITGEAVLPSMIAWQQLWPAVAGERAQYLGHQYLRKPAAASKWVPVPADVRVVNLRPDLWLGPPSNTRQKDETRRYDGSDYELIPLTQSDYREMATAGITCVKAVGGQQAWAEELGLYFWGPHERLPYPELLYRSQYLGPTLFLDEPAVGTRDHDLRPRLAKDPQYRKQLNPQEALRAYQEHYAKTITDGPPQVLLRTLAARKDVDLGALRFAQQNLYNWETMPSTAAWALSQDPHVPSAMVFEPPGRMGTRRTLPEWNMTLGTQFRADDMRVLPAVVFGFLRGAARLTGKQWGVSIYGAVERADTFLWMTQAYDMGATRFFFWDNYQLACVPFGEVLALSRHLQAHARQHPRLDLDHLRNAAKRAILLPPGYDLGHVQMGRGNLWGLGELNLERVNRKGVKHREVMARFFAEIENSLRAGVSFDLLWDLPGLKLNGYREVVRVAEDATAPLPHHQNGPALSVTVSTNKAIARVSETRAPFYYTLGADPAGVLHNAGVLWELFGPNEEDYLFLQARDNRPLMKWLSHGEAEVEVNIPSLKPGNYRLRAAVADVEGRSTVVWRNLRIGGNQ